MSKHIATVQNIYAAFGRGDVPAILEQLSDEVVWEYAPVSQDVPWLQSRRGRAAAAGFFTAVATEMEMKAFDVTAIAGTDRVVIALANIDFVVKRTGKTVREIDEAHIWHFDDKGRVIKFRHASDTHAHYLAYHP